MYKWFGSGKFIVIVVCRAETKVLIGGRGGGGECPTNFFCNQLF